MTSRKSLVLVVGAGASCEVGLPMGSGLKRQIAEALDIKFPNGFQQSSGDLVITEALRIIVNKEGGRDINPLLHTAWRIRDAMVQAISIDNFIDSHRDDKSIAICGKLAIARCIAEAERSSTLFFDARNEQKPDLLATSTTWFNSFFQLLTENCQQSDLPNRLKGISVITFNYDRCFEHYMYWALQNYYGMAAQQAAEYVGMIEIHHPYGRVGDLPWMKQLNAPLEFGGQIGAHMLLSVAQSLRTFTEGVDPAASDINAIRSNIAHADKVLFLGFAYHRLNMKLLFDELPEVKHLRKIFGTAFGLSPSDIRSISSDLLNLYNGMAEVSIRGEFKCAGLFGEYWRSLAM